MREKRLRLYIYIFALIVALIISNGFSYLDNSISEENKIELTTDDIDKLLRDDQGATRLDYYAPKSNYDGEVIAATNNLQLSIKNDLVTFSYSPSGGFYFGTNKNAMNNITAYGGIKSGSTGKVSLKNGKYYFGVYNSNISKLVASDQMYQVVTSCNNSSVQSNMTGNFTAERCYVKYSNGQVVADSTSPVGSCASGYTMSYNLASNACNNLSMEGLSRRYCKVIVQVTCTKNSSSSGNGNGNGGGSGNTSSTPAASLSSLSISDASLSPAFKSGTQKYSATVESNVTSVRINATAASGSTLVSGAGSRDVNLNYGDNSFNVKVRNSAGKVTTYTINIYRKDNRSTVNALSNLTVSTGNLNPAFSSNETNYVVDIPANVTSIVVDGTLTDNNSVFVAGYGPRTVSLEEGSNTVILKVAAQNGATKVYTIIVNRTEAPTECTMNPGDYALLKQIEFDTDINGLEVDGIEDFDPEITEYDVDVPNSVTVLNINAYKKDDADTVEISGNDDLMVNVVKTVTIKVTSSHCPGISKEYVLNVTRQPKKELSSIADLKNLIIEDYKIDFKMEQTSYGIKLKKGDTQLKITPEPVEGDKTKCEIIDNNDLKVGSQIQIRCTAEDEETVQTYTVSIDGVEKGTNVFFIIIVVILIILVLIYLLLRLLGYKIVFNFAVFGAFFRGIGEKFNNMFDK